MNNNHQPQRSISPTDGAVNSASAAAASAFSGVQQNNIIHQPRPMRNAPPIVNNNNMSTSRGTSTTQANSVSPLPNNGRSAVAAAPALDVYPSASSPHAGVSPQDGNNQDELPGADPEFPQYLICPYTNTPPSDGVYIEDNNLPASAPRYVFERSALYRAASISLTGNGARYWFHPITRQAIRRDRVMDRARDVSPDLQRRLDQERFNRSLTPADDDPLDDFDRARYHWTVNQVGLPRS